MEDFKAKKRCTKRSIPVQEPPPFLISKNSSWIWHYDGAPPESSAGVCEYYLLEGDSQRSLENSEAHRSLHLVPFSTIIVNNEKQLLYYFIDSKKCTDFDKGEYTPWPLALE